jgi:molybdate transport system substrate-binding protein
LVLFGLVWSKKLKGEIMKNNRKKSQKIFILFTALVLVLSLFGCGAPAEEAVQDAAEIYVSAAASLTDALEEIQGEFAKESDTKVIFNFAGSGTLQKQIEEGAP